MNEQKEVAYKLAKQFITLSIAVKVVERDLAIFERGLAHFKLGHMYTEVFHQTIIAIRKKLQRVKKDMNNLNVRVFEEQATNGANVDPYIAKVFTQTVQFLEELGHEVVEDTPVIDEDTHFNMKIRFWTAAMYKELNELARQLETTVTEENVEPVVYSAYTYGKKVTMTELLEAIDIQNMISRQVGQFFTKYDVFVTPTTAQLPLPLGELNTVGPYMDVVEWFHRSNEITAFEGLYNTTEQPAMLLPLGFSKNGLPIGMQFAGRFADETTLLQLAHDIEKRHNWQAHTPPIYT